MHAASAAGDHGCCAWHIGTPSTAAFTGGSATSDQRDNAASTDWQAARTRQLAYMPQAAVTGGGLLPSPRSLAASQPRSNQGHGMGWEGSASTLPRWRRPPWRPCPAAAAPRPGGRNLSAGAARRQSVRCSRDQRRTPQQGWCSPCRQTSKASQPPQRAMADGRMHRELPGT